MTLSLGDEGMMSEMLLTILLLIQNPTPLCGCGVFEGKGLPYQVNLDICV